MSVTRGSAVKLGRLRRAPDPLTALRALVVLCDHVPVFQLGEGVKGVRLAGKFVGALADARATIAAADATPKSTRDRPATRSKAK